MQIRMLPSEVREIRVEERLAELVAFDTRNPGGDEVPLAEKLARDLTTLGARTVEVFFTAEGFALASVLVCEENGLLNDQPSHTAGSTPANRTSITPADKIAAVRATMIATLCYAAREKTRVDKPARPGIHKD